jgi:hypothetical protein
LCSADQPLQTVDRARRLQALAGRVAVLLQDRHPPQEGGAGPSVAFIGMYNSAF